MGKEKKRGMDPIFELKKQRFRFLEKLYEESKADPDRVFYSSDIGNKITGLHIDRLRGIVRYLEGEGLIREIKDEGLVMAGVMGGVDVAITHDGIKIVEKSRDNPQTNTEHFPPYQVIYNIDGNYSTENYSDADIKPKDRPLAVAASSEGPTETNLINERTTGSTKVFVCYSRRDSGDIAELIYNYLTDADYDVFIDVNTIRAGDVWGTVIEENISKCNLFVPIITHAALRSPEVEKEVLQALKEKKRIIPCIHKFVRKNEIKWGLGHFQGINFEDKYELVRKLHIIKTVSEDT